MDEAILKTAVEAALAKKATEPAVLKTVKLTHVMDYFFICSGQTSNHVKAIADNLVDELTAAGLKLLHKEGGKDARWVLLDFGWFVAHIMLQNDRDFYQLEQLWHDAERLEIAAT